MHIDSYSGFTLFCLLENLNMRLCVFHQSITTKDRQRHKMRVLMPRPRSGSVREFLVPFVGARTEQKQILLTSQLKKARHVPGSAGAR